MRKIHLKNESMNIILNVNSQDSNNSIECHIDEVSINVKVLLKNIAFHVSLCFILLFIIIKKHEN